MSEVDHLKFANDLVLGEIGAEDGDDDGGVNIRTEDFAGMWHLVVWRGWLQRRYWLLMLWVLVKRLMKREGRGAGGGLRMRVCISVGSLGKAWRDR